MTDTRDETAYDEYASRSVSGHDDGFYPGCSALKHAYFAGIEHARSTASPCATAPMKTNANRAGVYHDHGHSLVPGTTVLDGPTQHTVSK